MDKLEEMEVRVRNEENTSQQMLGMFLIQVAAINFGELLAKALIRIRLAGHPLIIGVYETYVGWIRLALVIVAMFMCIYRMKKLFFHHPDTRKLVVLWGVILIPIQIVNDLMVMLYTRMLEIVQHVLEQSGSDPAGQIFAMIYDSTHGFKYICIFLAILLGIIMTAEILEKRKLIIFSAAVGVLFILAFTLFKMQTISFDSAASFEIGINWTSTIFHLLTTFGLFMVGLYIRLVFRKETTVKKEN